MSDFYDGGEEAFTAEEQAAFDAMSKGDDTGSRPDVTSPAPETPVETAPPAADLAAAEAVAAAEATKAGDPPRDETGKFVPHAAMHQERERRKAAEAREATTREGMIRLEERLRVFSEAMGGGKPAGAAGGAPVEKPDPAKDIFAYLEHLEAKLAAVESGHQQTVQQTAAEREESALVNSYATDCARFAKSEPTFDAAYQFLIQNRGQELALNGFTGAAITKAIQADEKAIAAACLANGQSPAERIYEMAKIRGFRAAAPGPSEAEKAASAAAATAKAAETNAAKLAMAAAGQAASRSLSGAGGAAATEMTAETLANMPEHEFDAWMTANPRRLAELMGAGLN